MNTVTLSLHSHLLAFNPKPDSVNIDHPFAQFDCKNYTRKIELSFASVTVFITVFIFFLLSLEEQDLLFHLAQIT